VGYQGVLLFGGTGAVGGEVLKTLLLLPEAGRITALGRRKVDLPPGSDPSHKLAQETTDLNNPAAYSGYLKDQSRAICALGVGQPSKITREEFARIDRDLVLSIARSCREAGVKSFTLLSALGADARSAFFYPKVKGQLEDGLRELKFERLRLFRPSMILTPTNRYDWKQGIMLWAWPLLDPVLIGPLAKARGIRVEELGKAMALDAVAGDGQGEKIFYCADFKFLALKGEGRIAG
jgi:uncharacterized protein YbjT (DUF2867 family)